MFYGFSRPSRRSDKQRYVLMNRPNERTTTAATTAALTSVLHSRLQAALENFR